MRFLTRCGFGVFGVVVPLYMRDVGVSFFGLGVAFSVSGLVMSAGGVFFGAHSDRVGRKPYLILALALNSVLSLFYTQATSVSVFALLQALSGIASSLSGVIVPALLTDLTIERERGRKFGWMGGFGWIGTGLGYFLGGVISHFFGYAFAFILVSILTLTSCALVLLFIPSYHLPSRGQFNLSLVRGFSANLKVWLVIAFITALVIGPVEVIVIPSYTVSPGPLGMDKVVFGTFMAASYLIISSTQFVGGNLADKYSRRKLASLFFLVSSPFILVQPLYPSFAYFAFMYLLEGVGEGLSHPSRDAIVASSIREQHRGFEFGIVSFVGTIGSTIGFLMIGYVLDTYGFAYPFYIRAFMYIAVACLIYVKLQDRHQESELKK